MNEWPRLPQETRNVLLAAAQATQPFMPKDIGAKASDQTTRHLLLLAKYGMIAVEQHPIHRCWHLYRITDLGRQKAQTP